MDRILTYNNTSHQSAPPPDEGLRVLGEKDPAKIAEVVWQGL